VFQFGQKSSLPFSLFLLENVTSTSPSYHVELAVYADDTGVMVVPPAGAVLHLVGNIPQETAG
jgi:hypothetical protein